MTQVYISDNEGFPVLVVEAEYGTFGYDINTSTGEVTPTCVCSAWNESECCCAYDWGEREDDWE